MIKNQQEIVASFVDYLNTRFARADTTADRPLSSLLFDGIATELATTFSEVQQVQTEQGISNPTQSSTDGADGLAYNWNLTRRGAVASSGIVTFQKGTAPTTTLRIGNQDGSGGVIVATSRQVNGTVVVFTTTDTVYLTPATTMNPSTGFFEVDAPIQCLSLGAIGNVDANLITVLQSSVPGVDAVTNKIATTGGRESENNSTLLSTRIPAKVLGLQPGTIGGLVSLALAQDQVTDAIVVGPNDPEFTSPGIGGAVDLIVLGEQITPTLQFSSYVAGQSSVLLQSRPATSITSVTAVVGVTQTSLLAGVDFSFSQDLVCGSALSAESNDHLSWLSGRLPNLGTTVTIASQYDKVINDIQTVVDASDQHFITANVLVKRATQVLVDVSLTVAKVSGYDSSTVSANVATAISNLINNLGLGDAVQQSDIVVAVGNAVGVSSVTLPLGKLAFRGNSGTSDLSITKYQFPRVDALSLSITVS